MSDEQLAAAAAALNAPEAIVRRSAEARAKADGIPVEQVLAAWAGGESTPKTDDGSRTTEDEEAPPPAAEETADGGRQTAATEATADGGRQTAAEPGAEAPGAVPAVPAVAAAAVADIPDLPPAPETVSPAAAMDYPEVISVPTAGIKERTGGGVPGWLTSVFVAVPLFALFYLISNAGGVECGEGGALAVSPISGELVNCDGTPYEGSGAGGGTGGDFLAVGEQVYAEVAACQGCHGDQGQGGVGPPLSPGGGAHHLRQLRGPRQLGAARNPGLGSRGRGNLRGQRQAGGWGRDNARVLHSRDEQLRAVVYFERVRFGGANPEEALADCGLGEPAGGEGGGEEETGTTVVGEDGATETTVAGEEGATETTVAGEEGATETTLAGGGAATTAAP